MCYLLFTQSHAPRLPVVDKMPSSLLMERKSFKDSSSHMGMGGRDSAMSMSRSHTPLPQSRYTKPPPAVDRSKSATRAYVCVCVYMCIYTIEIYKAASSCGLRQVCTYVCMCVWCVCVCVCRSHIYVYIYIYIYIQCMYVQSHVVATTQHLASRNIRTYIHTYYTHMCVYM